MLSNRQTAVAVGILFLTATATYLSADTIIRSALRRPDFLIATGMNASPLKIAALLALVCGVANVAIALLVYPLLKHHSVRLALGYIALRVGELGPILLYLITPLLLVALGAELLDGNMDRSAASHFGSLLQALYSVSLQMVFLFTGTSGTIFAYLLYRTRLVPRPIAVLGVIGYPLLIVGTILYMFHLIDFFQGVGLLFAWVVGLFELILPVWLIAKGFTHHSDGPRRPATAAGAPSEVGR